MEFQEHFNVFVEQAKQPPADDPFIGACYQAFVRLCRADQSYWSAITTVLRGRAITGSHLVNLFFRAIQYLQFRSNNYSYPEEYACVARWEAEFVALFVDELRLNTFLNLLQHKHTGTTKYQRYAGPTIVMNSLSGNRPIRAADLGCGGNYGLPGIVLREAYESIRDETPDRWASSMIRDFPVLVEGWGIDKTNPYTEDAIAWRHACSFYPSELDNLPAIIDLESRLHYASGVRFCEVDIVADQFQLFENLLPLSKLDFVIISTVLYQLTAEAHNKLIDVARKLLTSDGVLIIQDFATVENARLRFFSDWGTPFTYRTFILSEDTCWIPQEVLQWYNGRCQCVRAGAHFDWLQRQAKRLQNNSSHPRFLSPLTST